MSTTKQKLLTKVSNYLNAVEDRLKLGSVPIVFDTDLIMESASVKTYDVKTLFSKHALYKLRTIAVSVLVKDTDPTSPVYNAYINSEAVITHSVSDLGIVTIANRSHDPVTVCIKISSPTVLL